IDSNILKELPEDIAQEVLASLTHQRQKQEQQQTDLHQNTTESDIQNNITQGDSNSRQTSAQNLAGGDNQALPSLSQLNMSCFEALPVHLQEEIRAEYAWQEKRAAEKCRHNVAVRDVHCC
ncbi:DNA repair protein REV1, partial [Elysia marginata]